MKSYKKVFPDKVINEVFKACGESVGVLLQQLTAICSSRSEKRRLESLKRWISESRRRFGEPCTNSLGKAIVWLKEQGQC